MQRIARWLSNPLDPMLVGFFLAGMALGSLWVIERNTTALVVLLRDLRAREVAASTYGEDREA